MPVEFSDYNHLPASEQELIQSHIMQPNRFMSPLLMAGMLDALLFGVLVTEVWSYHRWFNDTYKFKVLVFGLVMLNLLQTTMIWYTMCSMFGSGFGKWEDTTTNLYFETILILEALTGAVAQCFFLERAFVLLRKRKTFGWILIGVATPLIAAGCALGLASGSVTILASAGAGTLFGDFVVLTNLIIAWKSTTVLTDVILTGSIIGALLHSRTGWRQTDSAVTRLVRWISEAQALPLLAALAFLGSYAADSGGNYCLIPSFAEAKMCAISALHVLNSRGRMRHDLSTEHTSGRASGPNELTTKGRIQIQTQTQTVVGERDEYDPESQTRHGRTRTVGRRVEDGDDISLESFENAKSRASSDTHNTTNTTRGAQEAHFQEEALGGSQAKLVPVIAFEDRRW